MGVSRIAVGAPQLELVSRTFKSRTWERIEHLRDNADGFPTYDYLPHQVQGYREIANAFGTQQPQANEFLLHCAPGWQSAERDEVPVLLLHGMTQDAQCWYHCYGLGVALLPGHRNDGLAPYLVHKNKKVFAITFPHANGDQHAAGRLVGDAVARIKELTGAKQVDIVGHSMGGIAGRVYTTSAFQDVRYRGDVRKLITMGTPHLGTDLAFRMGALTGSIAPFIPLAGALMRRLHVNQDFNVGGPWDAVRTLTGWANMKQYSVHGGHFPGLAQLTYRWDDKYPVSGLIPDARPTYYGGEGIVGRSPGIDAAIEVGGHFIDHLRKHALAPKIQLYMLAGNRPYRALPYTTADSDGLVLVDSALAAADMTRRGAQLRDAAVLPVDHAEMLHSIAVKRWVLDCLNEN
jgi:pimeloyl-ACP methyl ester carboxylesterase